MPQHFPLNPGEQLYKYQLRNRIGGGGFGDVWLAHDHSIARDIAVKVLDASMAPVAEHLKEAKIGNQLDHQNLVKVHYADVINHNGTNLVIIAMDYHINGSIVGQVNAGNFLPIPDVLRCMIDILRGLEYLHEHRLYHSDIKPQNILLGDCGEGVLTDYGISCHAPNLQPVQPRSFYKLHIAPEVLSNNQINVQTDIYQVGITTFRLLNGIGTIREKFNQVGQSDYYTLVQQGKVIQSCDYQPFIPRNLKAVVNKAVQVEPSKRYQSAVEMRRAMERLSYPGFWTCDSCGNYVGENDGYTFRFDETPRGKNQYDFTAWKKNKTSGRETRVGSFCQKRMTRKQLEDVRRKFMQYVVTG